MEGADLAGYNPQAAIELQRVLLQATGRPNWKQVIEHYFTKTHPITQNRLTALEEEYHRPERIVYNADQPQQLFSDAALEDAKDLAREKLLQQLQVARTAEDWNNILDDIENNPRATFRDGLMALEVFRLQLDMRTALAAVYDALEHDRFGYHNAILYEANLALSGESLYCSLINPLAIESRMFSQPRSPDNDYRGKVLEDLVQNPTSEDTTLHDPDSINRTIMTDAIKFHRQHAVLVPPELPPTEPFTKLEDLFDHTNPAALKYWKIESHFDKKAKIKQHKDTFIANLAQRWLRGFEFHYTLTGQESIDLKNAALKLLEELPPKTSTDSITTSALPTIPSSLAELATTVQARLSRSEKQVALPATINTGYQLPPTRSFESTFQPFQHAAMIGSGTRLSKTRFGKIYQRLQKLLRHHFDAVITPDHIEHVTGERVTTVTQTVKDELFRRATHDTIYPKFAHDVILFDDLKDLQQWKVVPTVMRTLPVYDYTHAQSDLPFTRGDRLDYVDRFNNLHKPLLEVMTGALGLNIHAQDHGKIGAAMRTVQTLQNHPYIQQLARGIPEKPSTHMATVAGTVYKPPFFHQKDIKRVLFKRWLEEGLRINLSEPNRPAWLQEIVNILRDKAEQLGLPENYFLVELDKPTGLAGLMSRFFKKPSNLTTIDETELQRPLNRLATELYAAGVAEDATELRDLFTDASGRPIEINFYDEAR